jgi:hypothetical protein
MPFVVSVMATSGGASTRCFVVACSGAVRSLVMRFS